MCGFVVAFDFENKNGIKLETIKKMTDDLKHRGPDGLGFKGVNTDTKLITDFKCDTKDSNSKLNLCFGFRRLSIQDLSENGDQPMISQEGNLIIVFNGEIYNFSEIRSDLESLGKTFKSTSDTEVILSAYEYYGEKCVEKFNGMWSFIIYDLEKNHLFISRDRFGIKPLYYTVKDGIIYFSSEANTFRNIPNFRFVEDRDFLKKYLKKGCHEWEKKTPFKDIYRFDIASNCILNVDDFDGLLDMKPYWSLKVNLSSEKFDSNKAEKYSKQYYDLLYDAVKIRLRSDVEVGSALSGGIDSSSIVYLINQILYDQGKTHKQATFSTVYSSPEMKYCDETLFIEKMVNDLNIKSHVITPKVDEIPNEHFKATKAMELLFDGTAMSGWHTYKLTKSKNIKVTIDGQGADEQLGGYLHYFHSYIGSSSISSIFKKIYYCLKIPGSRNFVLRGVVLKILSMVIGKKNTEALLRKVGISFTFNLNETLATQFQQSLVNLLYNADRQSMAHSVESRLPFMDYRLVEFLFSIPACYKIHNGWTKHIARMAFNGKLPNEICWRKDKMGWPVPEEVWFSRDLNQWFNEQLKNNFDFLLKVGVSEDQLTYNKELNKIKVRLLNISRWYNFYLKKQL